MSPWTASRFVAVWLFLAVALSVISMIGGGWITEWTALAPERIWHGQVWRLVTWPLVHSGVWAVASTAVVLVRFADPLAQRWGDHRIRRYVTYVVVSGGAITCVLALVVEEVWQLERSGGLAVNYALIIAWARHFPETSLQLFGVVELGGHRLIAIVLGLLVVVAVSFSPWDLVPELVVASVATIYPRGAR